MASRENARRFHFLREIAAGGFGTVWLCRVQHADGFSRVAAVKLLKSQWSDSEEIVRRIRDEARLLGLLRHRSIITVYDLTSIDGRAAVVMEFVDGVDLRTIVKALRGRGETMPLRAVLDIGATVASALDAAYNRPPMPGDKPLRVIHRDIKPSNVMIDGQGEVKVLDFGVARSDIENRESHTEELQFGSVDYMAPERLFFEPETPAGDVYALGATLFELLAQEKLGKARGRPAQHAAEVEDRLSFLRATLRVRSTVATELMDLLRASVAFEHERRPTAAQLSQRCRALARLVEDEELQPWAERVVPPLAAAAADAPRKPNVMTDSVRIEDSVSFGATGGPMGQESAGFDLGARLQKGALAELEDSSGRVVPATAALLGDESVADPPTASAVDAPSRAPFRPPVAAATSAPPPPAAAAVVAVEEEDPADEWTDLPTFVGIDPGAGSSDSSDAGAAKAPLSTSPLNTPPLSTPPLSTPPPALGMARPGPVQPPPALADQRVADQRVADPADPEPVDPGFVHAGGGFGRAGGHDLGPIDEAPLVVSPATGAPTRSSSSQGGRSSPGYEAEPTVVDVEDTTTPGGEEDMPEPLPAPRPRPAGRRKAVVLGGLAGGCLLLVVTVLLVVAGGVFYTQRLAGQPMAAQSEVPPSADSPSVDSASVVPPGDKAETAVADAVAAPAAAAQPVADGMHFESLAPATRKLNVRCTDGEGRGSTEATVSSSAAERCTVTAIMEDRSRLVAVVDQAQAGAYGCFADGEASCERR